MFEIIIIFLIAFSLWWILMLFIKPVKQETGATLDEERIECSVCGKFYPRNEMLERELGDSKVYLFCGNCIARMQKEALEKG